MDDVLPFVLTRYFTQADLARGATWALSENLTSTADNVLDLTILLVATFGHWGRRLWTRCESWGSRGTPGSLDRVLGPGWRTGALFLAAVTLMRNVATFPLELWCGYFEAHALGLSHQSLASFLGRHAMGWSVSIAVNALLGAILGAVRARWPRTWWLAIGAAAALALVGDATLEPLRANLEYKVRPLADGPLRQRLESFLASHDAHVGDIMVVETSRRGTGVNAFVTGLGPTRRLVLTDTLLALGDDAVFGAVAHEVGHRRETRLPGRLFLAALGLIGVLWLFEQAFRFAFRHGAGSEAQAYPFVRAFSIVLLMLLAPVHATLGKQEEREADTLELQSRHDYDAYIAEQVKLVRANATNPSPPAWLDLMLDHPSPAERIGRALWYKERVAGNR